MEEILQFILTNPKVLLLVEGVAAKVAYGIVADIFHRRATDPSFLAASDAAFAQLAAAPTAQEKQNALTAIENLMGPPPATPSVPVGTDPAPSNGQLPPPAGSST